MRSFCETPTIRSGGGPDQGPEEGALRAEDMGWGAGQPLLVRDVGGHLPHTLWPPPLTQPHESCAFRVFEQVRKLSPGCVWAPAPPAQVGGETGGTVCIKPTAWTVPGAPASCPRATVLREGSASGPPPSTAHPIFPSRVLKWRLLLRFPISNHFVSSKPIPGVLRQATGNSLARRLASLTSMCLLLSPWSLTLKQCPCISLLSYSLPEGFSSWPLVPLPDPCTSHDPASSGVLA